MATPQQIEAAYNVFTNALNEMVECERCQGRGYHHGFGENGHDPDWCEHCGGNQFVAKYDEMTAMGLAIDAASNLR